MVSAVLLVYLPVSRRGITLWHIGQFVCCRSFSSRHASLNGAMTHLKPCGTLHSPDTQGISQINSQAPLQVHGCPETLGNESTLQHRTDCTRPVTGWAVSISQ